MPSRSGHSWARVTDMGSPLFFPARSEYVRSAKPNCKICKGEEGAREARATEQRKSNDATERADERATDRRGRQEAEDINGVETGHSENEKQKKDATSDQL